MPILIVHVSDAAGRTRSAAAQTRGLRVCRETCPQYLFLTARRTSTGPGLEGAKYGCSPPPRDRASQQAIWRRLADGTFQAYSSDHAPYRFDESGKLPKGDQTTFKDMANGVPGIELRLPLLFSEGVGAGRALAEASSSPSGRPTTRSSTGSIPQGTIAVGGDADLALWDPRAPGPRHGRHAPRPRRLHPYEGRELTGWPVTVTLTGAARRPGRPAPCRARQRPVRGGRACSSGRAPRGGSVPELARLALGARAPAPWRSGGHCAAARRRR